ncbi:leucine-rich repeat protein [Butyrivibrio sp. INlla16]|uniref:leucine-rich repeat protein n=1 Tax=Butyrivibrio sp. INlla16 TaxID=1520807 RepID=UPI001A9A6753|nr:leucine-rich repeat protein [Butyrivibrio sp. INlla16]
MKNGKWDDGTDATKVVKVGPTTQFRLPYDKIPEAGTMPNAGYSPGRWSKIPDTTTVIRSGTTYTYTYWSAAGAAFETVKTAKIADVDMLAKADDNAVCRNLIADAKDEIDEYVYEDEMTQEQNTAVLDEIEDRLKRDLSFERERAAKIAEVEGFAKSGDNDECKKLIADAKTALESYFYDEDKTLDNNKAALQVIINELKQKLPAERIKAAKIAKIAEVEALAKADDSDASKKLIADAKAALEAYEYDDSKTEAENIAALEAIVSKLKTDLEKQREADKPQTDDNTVINPDGTKTVTKVREDSKGSIEIVVTTYDKADKAISEYDYQLAKSGTLDLKKVSVNNKKVVIPDTVKADGKTYKVTRLKKGFMKKCKKVTAVDVGKNVNTIDKNALTGANKVKTVTIRSKLKKVGKGAFKVMKKGTIKMNVSKKVYQKNLKLIEKSGISDNVKIKRVKGKK